MNMITLKKLFALTLLTATVATFSGCSKKEKTLAGIGIGAATGGIIGGTTGGSTGAALGVVGGGLVGGLIGNSMGDDK